MRTSRQPQTVDLADGDRISARLSRRGSQRSVGVLTFHRCINYGSYWQARCLLEGLQATGEQPVLLDHWSSQVARSELTCAVRPLLPHRGRLFDPFRYAGKIARFSNALRALPKSHRFALENPAEMPSQDLVVIGSDEVWNLSHPWYSSAPAFFGIDVPGRKVVTYAASFGNHQVSGGLPEARGRAIASLDAVSVRDEHSRRIVQSATGKTPALVLDPCLQFPIVPGGDWNGPEGPFVCVYGHGFDGRFARAVREAAGSLGLRLVSVGYRNDWADVQWLSAGPLDFARAMARASAVATNFFHGCVFAFAHGRPLVCDPSEYRATKIADLLGSLNAEWHRFKPEWQNADVEARLSEPPGSETAERIASHRRSSAEFLETALAI